MSASTLAPKSSTAPAPEAARSRFAQQMQTKAPTAPGLLTLFFIVIMIPVSFSVGGVSLSPTRLLLLAMIGPAVLHILTGKVGGVTRIDIALLIFAVWNILSLMINHGFERLPFAFITAVELVGGYMLGRIMIRNASDFRLMFRIYLLTLLLLAPFAIMEALTGRLVIPSLLDPIFDVPVRGHSAYGRMGLERVYGVFDHPILYGLYCSVAFANLWMIYPGFFRRAINSAITIGMTFLSLSSAPLLMILLQSCLLGWNWITKGRWVTLIILGAIGYVVVDSLSNRSPVVILIETITFNSNTGWIRIATFEYGLESVKNRPLFGMGFNDWERPPWLTASVDNFWLFMAMRYGVLGFILMVLAFGMHLWQAARIKIEDAEIDRYRVGYCIALAAIAFCLITVQVWDTVGVFIMFYLGAGAWFYCGDEENGGRHPRRARAAAGQDPVQASDPSQPPLPAEEGPPPRYTRFARPPGAQKTARRTPRQRGAKPPPSRRS